jgi:hypothetical protein
MLGLLLAHSGYWTVIGCRATPSDTKETYALLQQFSISQCRQADDHQVFREVACVAIVLPNAVLFRPATQSGFSKTFSGLETRAKLLRNCSLSLRWCRRKTCFTSKMERNNAWLRRLIGRLLVARVLSVSYPCTLATVRLHGSRNATRCRFIRNHNCGA